MAIHIYLCPECGKTESESDEDIRRNGGHYSHICRCMAPFWRQMKEIECTIKPEPQPDT